MIDNENAHLTIVFIAYLLAIPPCSLGLLVLLRAAIRKLEGKEHR